MPVLFRLIFLFLTTAFLASCGGGNSYPDESKIANNQYLAVTQAAVYVQPNTGWYWNPAEGGRGFAIERQGSQLFMAGFYYETTGEASWGVSTLSVQADGQYTGELMRYSGGQTLLGAYKTPLSSKIAALSLSFTTATAGSLRIIPTSGATPVSIALETFPISTPIAFAPSDGAFESGWWWNAAEGGRGYFIDVQGAQAFIGSFMYESNGQPAWYVSTATLQGPFTVGGTLDQYTNGQSLLGSFKPATKTSTSAGTMSFRLTSANTGILTLPNNATVAITRFVFNPGTPPTEGTQALLISEVSTAYYSNDVAWLEVYNPNTTTVLLSNYTLRSSAINTTSNVPSATPVNFSLPAVYVPAKGYLVIASKMYNNLLNNSQIVYVSNGNSVPWWSANGSVELINTGQTADFVRFGTSSATPMTAGHWSGPSVAALPSGGNEHGKSIVRLASRAMIDTNSASDWTQVNFATPAGPNDVAAGVIDSDNDGIPDSAKVAGGTYAGLDLYAMGARPGRRDAFIEIDYMKKPTDAALVPRQEALQKLADAFATKSIALHLDAGSLYSATFNPSLFNLGGGNATTYATCLELNENGAPTPGCTSLYDYKSAYFDVRRKLVFHYALFGNSQLAGGGCGSSGRAEIGGNDLFITMGDCNYTTTAGTALNLLINGQACALMHEFGHNLGLEHGGNENKNYKPNYYSIMNYLYQFRGLSASPSGTTAADRYYRKYNLKGVTNAGLDNSPQTNNFIMDFSDGSGVDLDENNLQESLNIGRGSTGGAYADWNDDGVLTTATYARNIHSADTTYGLGVLKDYNDWANLVFPFARGYASNSGVSPLEKTFMPRRRVNPMNQRPRKIIVEDRMPHDLQQQLRALRNETR
jgi:hypothetical protein